MAYARWLATAPIAGRDGHEFAGPIDERVSGVAAVVDSHFGSRGWKGSA